MSDAEQWEHDEQRMMENEITTLREQVEKAQNTEAVATMKLGEALIKIGCLEDQVATLTLDLAANRQRADLLQDKLNDIYWKQSQ